MLSLLSEYCSLFAKNVAFKVNWSQDHHNLSVAVGKYQTTAAMCSENIPQENKSGSNIYIYIFFLVKVQTAGLQRYLEKDSVTGTSC